MRIRKLLPILALAVLGGAPAHARQAPPAPRATAADVLLRIDAPVTIAAGDSVTTLVVVGDDADVRGAVGDRLIVLGGTARVSGTVHRDVAVVGGALELAPTARVGGDVYLYRSTMARAPGASVAGVVERGSGPPPTLAPAIALAFWTSATLVALALGLLFAAAGRASLLGAAETLTHDVGASVGAALVTWGAGTTAALACVATVVGIPLGLLTLLLLLPALGFAGYLVAGAAAGEALLSRLWHVPAGAHPYRAVALGVLALQLVTLVPVLGAATALAAGAVGAGALVYRVWQRRRGERAPALSLAPLH